MKKLISEDQLENLLTYINRRQLFLAKKYLLELEDYNEEETKESGVRKGGAS